MKDRDTRRKVSAFSFSLVMVLAIFASIPSAQAASGKTYTLDADFNEGIMNGVNHDEVHDQLQLNKSATTFPFMWIANAGEDTVSKIDTKTGKELARYRTWFGPAGQPGYFNHLGNAWAGASPSRTAVDKDGNVYVANRHFDNKPADIIKILLDGGIDRNGNGVIDTSVDTNANGIIEAGEILPMGDSNGNGKIDPSEIQDERIAWVVQVGPNSGLGRSTAIDTGGNIWIGLYNSKTYYKINSTDGSILAGPIDVKPNTPYGALVDKNGVLWGASLDGTLLKLNTSTNTVNAIYNHNYGDYGIALGNDKVYQAITGGSTYSEFDPIATIFSYNNLGFGSMGIATDSNGNIFVGNPGISKVKADSTVIWSSPSQTGGSEVRGIVVDSDDNVWTIHRPTNNIAKYRGSDGAALGVFPVGDQPYTYSDATGLALRTSITPTGTWTVIYDGVATGTSWGRVSWTENVPDGASIEVKIRTADTIDGLELVSYQSVGNGIDFSATGRYIQIQTRLTANAEKVSPILYDLTVMPKEVIAGFMTGGGSVFTEDGKKVTHGFELNCDKTQTPNNLEVNWDKGNKFHLETLDSAYCFDDSKIVPNPPPAGFDTYKGTGTGRYNGVAGATAEWTFTDAGEPGKEDTAKIQIKDVNDNVVLTVSGKLNNGNQQAHKSK